MARFWAQMALGLMFFLIYCDIQTPVSIFFLWSLYVTCLLYCLSMISRPVIQRSDGNALVPLGISRWFSPEQLSTQPEQSCCFTHLLLINIALEQLKLNEVRVSCRRDLVSLLNVWRGWSLYLWLAVDMSGIWPPAEVSVKPILARSFSKCHCPLAFCEAD